MGHYQYSTANIARTQLIPAIFRSSNAEVTAISSRSAKVHEVAATLNIPKAYESNVALLEDPDIDAVYIPPPNHLHKERVFKAAAKGKHILCEKPAALSAAEAEEMLHACKSDNVKFMEAFMYQLHPQHTRVKEIITSGEIGEIKLIQSSHSFYLENHAEDIRMDKSMGGGSLYDLGCYSIQAIRHLSGAKPVEVRTVSELDAATGVDMLTCAYLILDNGMTAIFDCSFDMVSRNEYEVVGQKEQLRYLTPRYKCRYGTCECRNNRYKAAGETIWRSVPLRSRTFFCYYFSRHHSGDNSILHNSEYASN